VIAVWILLGCLGVCALITFGWCLRAGMEPRSGGDVDLSRAAARGELDRRRTERG
jgi:hypothetical protein